MQTYCNTLQHNEYTRQHTATYSNALQHNADTLQHTATHCNTLQHTATKCKHTATHCNTLQHTATQCRHNTTHCNTLQYTATNCYRHTHDTFVTLHSQWNCQVRVVMCVAACCRHVHTATHTHVKHVQRFIKSDAVLQCAAVCCKRVHIANTHTWNMREASLRVILSGKSLCASKSVRNSWKLSVFDRPLIAYVCCKVL